MKILIGGLVAESNAYVAKPCEIQDFVIQTGEDIAHRKIGRASCREREA